MKIKRSINNPILSPRYQEFWEAEGVFNGSVVVVNKNNTNDPSLIDRCIDNKEITYMVYRAWSKNHYFEQAKSKMMVSIVGIAESNDGGNTFYNRKKFIEPVENWEKFGCEDPRITKLNDKYYIFYTALSEYPFNANGIKVGVAITNDLNNISERHLVTPFNAKGMALFPEKINNKIFTILTLNTDIPPAKICIASFDNESDIWNQNYWNEFYNNHEQYVLNLARRSQDQVEVGSPPIKTNEGWLIIYSYTQDYYTRHPIFTIEAALLDLQDPSKIIATTKVPILTPQEYYEKVGHVENVVFPSGATLKEDILEIYYGGADTFCCKAEINIHDLLDHMMNAHKKQTYFKRSEQNPILTPNPNNSWENKAVFNPACLYINNKFHIVYRAMGWDNTSVMGYAISPDGINIEYRSDIPIYVPRESFEQKKVPNGNSGCEDPRLTEIDGKIYMLYTAYNGQEAPRVALTYINQQDFLDKKWDTWSKPILISAPGLDDKDAIIFDQKYNNKYILVHRLGTDIDIAFEDSLEFNNGDHLGEGLWFYPRKGFWDSKKIGAAAPPVRTNDGWVMLYHGVSEDSIYRVGAVLLDLSDPQKILGRTDMPILEPELDYEKFGQVNQVVFPCGNCLVGDELFIFYGGGDSVIGMAKINIHDLIKILKKDGYV